MTVCTIFMNKQEKFILIDVCKVKFVYKMVFVWDKNKKAVVLVAVGF